MWLAVLLAFALIAASAGLQVWQTQRLVRTRQLDAPLIEAAGGYGAVSQRIGRLASQVAVLAATRPDAAAQAAARLGDEISQSRAEALALIDHAMRVYRAQRLAEIDRAIERWDAAREKLWYRADALVGHVEADRLEAVATAAQAVQAESEAAAQAAQALVAALRARMREIEAEGLQFAQGGAALTLLLLALLALAVVMPALRALKSQAWRLAQQAAENARLALVAEHTGNLVLITDRERRLVWTNPAFTRTTGWELHEVIGRSPGQLLQSELTDTAEVARMRAALESGQSVRAELLNRSRDGRDYWIDADIQPLRDAEGRIMGHLAVQTVITEQVTQRLRSASLLAALPIAVVVHDRDGSVREANRAARELLGLAPGAAADAILARTPVDDDLEPLAAEELPVACTLRSARGERGRVLGLDDGEGGRRWLIVNTEPLADALGNPDGVVSCWVDMTERRRLLEQLRDSACRDPLTRMPNRSVVLERVQAAIDHRGRHPQYGFAVLFMDMDRFKQVNDTLGHGAGDDLLRQVAARLEETLRPGDALARIGSEMHTAARIGGDEFVIVLENITELDQACQVADRLLQELVRPYQLGPHAVHVTASMGIVGAEQVQGDAESVLRDCDTAMYEAKRAGRGRWMVFDPSMHQRVRAALELEGDLRRALAADEFHVVYQPVFDLAERQLAGVEALVRWRHPQHGEVAPGQFIPLAEECGLIDEIGDAVLRKACAAFAGWQQRWGWRAPRQLAVNLSRAQLRQPGLVPEVKAVLESNGLRPEQLQLEITESFAAQDALVQSSLRALKAAGVRLALDDFGTGYSSLACLHQLPVDTVKVDRSFVVHAREVEYHRVLISATIRVARTLGMTTVAEGIETDDQAELMAALGCDRGQGWLFGRPQTAEGIEELIEREASDTVA